HDGVYRADPCSQRIDSLEPRHDRPLVRHRHIASAPVRVVPAVGEVIGQRIGGDMRRAIFGVDAELAQPIAMDRRRLRLRDRIADHFRIGTPGAALSGSTHAGSFPNSRSAPSTGNRGIPSTVNMSPSMLSNSCGPRASMRNTPTHWLTSGHSAARYFSMKASDRSRTLRRARAT